MLKNTLENGDKMTEDEIEESSAILKKKILLQDKKVFIKDLKFLEEANFDSVKYGFYETTYRDSLLYAISRMSDVKTFKYYISFLEKRKIYFYYEYILNHACYCANEKLIYYLINDKKLLNMKNIFYLLCDYRPDITGTHKRQKIFYNIVSYVSTTTNYKISNAEKQDINYNKKLNKKTKLFYNKLCYFAENNINNKFADRYMNVLILG